MDSEQYCPIALAFHDALPSGNINVWVVGKWAVIGNNEWTTPYALPQRAREWMWKFDISGKGDPIEFTATKDVDGKLIW